MLEMQKLSKIYRTDTIETHALSEFDLEVKRGEFLAIMGPSGCGKTTFLNVTGLLDTFESGTYLLDGKDVSNLNDAQMSRIRNDKIGFIFQSFNLIPDLNVFDNVDVPLRYGRRSAQDRKRAIEQALETVGLRSRIKHYPSQLSGGQQQRVAIARALVNSPKLILADEPTGNLDSQMAGEIMGLLEKINQQGTTVIMVTHDPDLSARAARTVHLRDGRIVSLQPETSAPLHTPVNAASSSEAAC